MLSIDSDITGQLDAGATIVRTGIRFEFGTGTFCVAAAAVPFSFGGNTFHPMNYLALDDLSYAPGTAAQDFKVVVGKSGDDSAIQTVFRNIYSHSYQDRPVSVIDVHFDIETGQLIDGIILRKGYVDRVVEQVDNERGEYLEFECLSRALDYSRANGRLATDADQQRRSSGDRFFQHSSKTGRTEIFWGRERRR